MVIPFYDAKKYGVVKGEKVHYNMWARDGYGTRLSNRLEIELTTDCNLNCVNCDRSCRQAPSKENISYEQIKRFVDESVERKHFWYVIKLAGGEPTLHPDFERILLELKRCKDQYVNTKIWVNSNGFSPLTKEKLKWVADFLPWVHINSSGKTTPNVTHHDAYNLAPKDFSVVAPPCHRPWDCGLGLSRYGFFPCGAGAAIARVFGMDIGIKSIEELTHEAVLKQLLLLCPLCGYSPTKVKRFNVADEPRSKSWIHAYEQYAKNPPRLNIIYGDTK